MLMRTVERGRRCPLSTLPYRSLGVHFTLNFSSNPVSYFLSAKQRNGRNKRHIHRLKKLPKSSPKAGWLGLGQQALERRRGKRAEGTKKSFTFLWAPLVFFKKKWLKYFLSSGFHSVPLSSTDLTVCLLSTQLERKTEALTLIANWRSRLKLFLQFSFISCIHLRYNFTSETCLIQNVGYWRLSTVLIWQQYTTIEWEGKTCTFQCMFPLSAFNSVLHCQFCFTFLSHTFSYSDLSWNA